MPTVERPRISRPQAAAKYATALLVGLGTWALGLPETDPTGPVTTVEAFLFLDLFLGVAVLAVLPLRRRFPVGVAVGLSLVLAVSGAATGAWSFAAVSLGRRRRVAPAVLVLVLATASALAYEAWFPYPSSPDEAEVSWWVMGVLVALMESLALAVGFYLGARDALLDSLRERAEAAEHEQHSRTAQARAAERARIAREMHDVLAHRISTVAMHSGALAYRTDLTPEEVSGAARLIQENAHSALVELRDILGVLRETAEDDAHGVPEPPQPTIADLDTLVAEAVAAGQVVSLDVDIDAGDVPGPLGRHVYRAVQECLTNARKHAPGAPLDVRIARESAPTGALAGLRSLGRGGAGDLLVVDVSNPLTASAPGQGDVPGTPGLFATLPARGDTSGVPAAETVPTSGVGLLGLAERAELSGGHLDHGPEGGRYRTRLVVPWPERSPV
ncbi:sensor histidine kinase [Mobilicoccus pelagius]|uniref:histidine kinase n=1 Tax=Mobilicoccus pelagius NBRC 104925 TaxID=1089455 RepID=H5UV37_9MICO|nr:histidine kinase [Mobilicoccus pelagius]GAB49595.1 putative two-component histidine kinase [Mobilicoccus pelagius NBRC 104925]